MYNEGGGAALGTGGVVTAGGLAYTGFSTLAWAAAAFALIVLGVVLLRIMSRRAEAHAASTGPVGGDPQAALEAAIEALGQDDR